MAYYADPSTDSRAVLRGTAETLSVTFYSGETATDADGGTASDSASATDCQHTASRRQCRQRCINQPITEIEPRKPAK